MTRGNVAIAAAVALGFALGSSPALAGSHLWRFNEIFTSSDGSVVFIEMKECCGANNEVNLSNKWVNSVDTGAQFTFPGNLPCNNCTANKHLLLATQSFADLPGAPTPDYIIPESLLPFFDDAGDMLKYWLYGGAADWLFGPVPTDGVNSLNRDSVNGDFMAVNSPTNFAGETGSVVVEAGCAADLDGSGEVDSADLALLLGAWGPIVGDPADLNGDDRVDAIDLAEMLGSWGPC